MDTPVNSSASAAGGSSAVLAMVYWLVVTIPLAWGVFQTAQKAVPLFHVTSAPTAAAAAPTVTPAPEAAVAPLATATPVGTVGPIATPMPTP